MNQLYTQDGVAPLMIHAGEVRLRRQRVTRLAGAVSELVARARVSVHRIGQRATA